MQLHDVKRRHRNRRSIQVGRGGKRGKTSGRGGKGQTARAGHKVRPELRDIIKRLPKRRGRGKHAFTSFRARPAAVNLGDLEALTEASAVTPMFLREHGLISSRGGRLPQVKILGAGTLTKKLSVSGCSVSRSAREAIEKAGGTIE